jgi:hypothetical protein
LKELPEKERFTQLRTTKKHFIDTIKLIAYRAETALVQLVREKLARTEDARALVRQVFTSAVDLDPNPAQKTLTVRIHRLSRGDWPHLLCDPEQRREANPVSDPRCVMQCHGQFGGHHQDLYLRDLWR